MRLIQTAHPIGLGEFWDNEVANLKYAILSHRWEGEEVAFQEMMEPTEQTRQKNGYQKIARFCERARADGFEYMWVDTCCINKESSAELTESINSMFRWYLESARCYAYMSDVADQDRDKLVSSVWFTRGWTLQELVAPREMVFLDNTWSLIGSREDLCHEIEKVTRIETSLLLGKSRLDQFSVAKRMSWASTRETSKAEDRAYCLMGIFNVNMPLLYGEGDNAFIRLQEEIMKNSNDETLFAWESNDVSKKKPCGFLARSPKDFANSGDIFPISVSKDAMPFTATNRGIRIQSPLLPPRVDITTLILQCSTGDGVIGIGVMSKPGTANGDEDFVRRKGSLKREIPFDLLFDAVLDIVYIPKSFVGGPSKDDAADALDSNDDANSESDSETPGGVLRSRIQPRGHHKKLIISFDDTQGRFAGDESDSNVAKIHRMFERSEDDQVCFYRAWTLKTTLEEIVMDGYRFLMEHHQRGDVISFFGYSKGGYAAHFLSNLIGFMGILVPGHDYMVSEVWRIFSSWVLSTGTTEGQVKAKKRHFMFMKAFRETFVRPANETVFFGVFDAIDLSLGKIQRSMNTFPPGQIVRHALSIDEQQVLLKPLRVEGGSDDECDAQEVWFPGCHQDVGGGIELESGELWPINHLSLVWMTNEARKAGLRFDPRTQARFECSNIMREMDDINDDSSEVAAHDSNDAIRATALPQKACSDSLRMASENGFLHDELTFGMGWSRSHVCKQKTKNFVFSKIPRHAKFPRKGNYRNINSGALIHYSALRRMKADPTYRPPNLRVSDTSKVVNKDETVAQYIVQEDDE